VVTGRISVIMLFLNVGSLMMKKDGMPNIEFLIMRFGFQKKKYKIGELTFTEKSNIKMKRTLGVLLITALVVKPNTTVV
ncbi:MAG TPA: hypothetical protein DEA82_00995, partial [Flavobacteriaceae bacterium]|nr:hypothetical protein [Flavobacteriaceae bacterium]